MKRRQTLQIALSLGLMTSVAGCSNESTSSNSAIDTDEDGVPDEHDYAPTDPDVQSKSDTESEPKADSEWTTSGCNEGDFQFQIVDVSFDDTLMSVTVKNITTSQLELGEIIVELYVGEPQILETMRFELSVDGSYPVLGTYDTIGIDVDDLYFADDWYRDDIESIRVQEPNFYDSDTETTCS
jgi:hypothetical protein